MQKQQHIGKRGKGDSADHYWPSQHVIPDHEVSLLRYLTFYLDDVGVDSTGYIPDFGEVNNALELNNVHAVLDAYKGNCLLKNPIIGQCIEQVLLSQDGSDYRLLSWVVAPNHVHVIIELIAVQLAHNVIDFWKAHVIRRLFEHGIAFTPKWKSNYLACNISCAEEYNTCKSYIEGHQYNDELIFWSSQRYRNDANESLGNCRVEQ